MNEQIAQIAERIRTLREINGIPSESLAGHLGISTDAFAALESGKTDISVSSLLTLAHAMGVELSALLTGENPRLHQYCVVRKGHGVQVERMKQYKYENLAYNFIHKTAEPFIVTAEPDEGPVTYNSHPGQEFSYVLEGAMTVYFDDHTVVLREGDSMYFDASHRHAMKAMNGLPVRFLALIM
jgi:mannose-6-phosphate isomerase-like protein (cupin superfamily)